MAYTNSLRSVINKEGSDIDVNKIKIGLSQVKDWPGVSDTPTDGSGALFTAGGAYTMRQSDRQYARSSNLADTKLFLIGATSQTTRVATRSNVGCYIGTDNCLYSNGTKVRTDVVSRNSYNGTISVPYASWTTAYSWTAPTDGYYLIIATLQPSSSAPNVAPFYGTICNSSQSYDAGAVNSAWVYPGVGIPVPCEVVATCGCYAGDTKCLKAIQIYTSSGVSDTMTWNFRATYLGPIS